MTSVGSTLFRSEVVAAKHERLHGNVNLVTPISWQVIGFLLVIALIISVSFLASANYTRVEVAAGTISLDNGVASIIPSRSGVITEVLAKDGQQVTAGAQLARVRSEEELSSGSTAPDRIRAALREQDTSLASQGYLLMRASEADRSRLRTQIAGARAESASLSTQIADQQRLVETAARQYSEVQKIAASGFVSRRDIEEREATVITRRQQLSQMQQALSAKQAQLGEAERAIVQSKANAQAQYAGTQSSRATLLRQIAENDLARGYLITTPVAGTVTAMTARIGQRASPDQALMLIVPERSRPTVELYVPTAAAGFISIGQAVRVAVDAFPYQRFGTIDARIVSVSAAAVAKQGAAGPTSVYLVTAALTRPTLRAYGREQRLLPGMTLSARIVTEQRTLLEWLFEPLFAVRNR